MMPPNTKPSAGEKFGIIILLTYATAQAVQITNPKANNPIGRLFRQKSCQEVFHAAEYNKGGRKINGIVHRYFAGSRAGAVWLRVASISAASFTLIRQRTSKRTWVSLRVVK